MFYAILFEKMQKHGLLSYLHGLWSYSVHYLSQLNFLSVDSFLYYVLFVGDISSRYGSHRQLNSGSGRSGQVGSALNKRLQFWTVCGATRTLLDINTQCMSCLMHSNTEACINALLGRRYNS